MSRPPSFSFFQKYFATKLAFSIFLLIYAISSARLSLVVQLASFLWHLFFLDPSQRIQAVSRSVVYVDKASHSPSPHRRNGYIIIVSAYVWRWRTDERAFENSFPKRTRSSISAYYSLLLYVFGMLTMVSLRRLDHRDREQ